MLVSSGCLKEALALTARRTAIAVVTAWWIWCQVSSSLSSKGTKMPSRSSKKAMESQLEMSRDQGAATAI